jgi:hypothetical protein
MLAFGRLKAYRERKVFFYKRISIFNAGSWKAYTARWGCRAGGLLSFGVSSL